MRVAAGAEWPDEPRSNFAAISRKFEETAERIRLLEERTRRRRGGEEAGENAVSQN